MHIIKFEIVWKIVWDQSSVDFKDLNKLTEKTGKVWYFTNPGGGEEPPTKSFPVFVKLHSD